MRSLRCFQNNFQHHQVRRFHHCRSFGWHYNGLRGLYVAHIGGNEANKSKGTNAIWAAVWGILITFGAYVIVNAIIGGLAGTAYTNPGINSGMRRRRYYRIKIWK